MIRKLLTGAIVIVFLAHTTALCADQAVILTDRELDSVYAKGFNLQLPEVVLANAANKTGNALNVNPGEATVVTRYSDKIRIITPATPLASSKPTKPSEVNPPQISSVAPPVTQPVVTTNETLNTATQSQAVSFTESMTTTTAVTSSGMNDQTSAVNSNNAAASNAVENSAALIPQLVSASTMPDGPQGTTAPVAPDAVELNPMSVDFVAAKDGSVAISGRDAQGNALTSAAVIPISSPTGSINEVRINDSAQSGLSALANVNAAGSIVPVQINLTVLINSHVETLMNTNNLDLGGYTTTQLK